MSLNSQDNLLNNKNKLTKSYSASLIVITDETDENFYNLTYLLNLFSKKLSDSGVFLRKTFFITKLDYADILQQFKQQIPNSECGKTEPCLNWVLVTTTKPSNDFLLDNLIKDTYKNKPAKATNILNNMPYTNGHTVEPILVYDNKVMLLKNKSLHFDLTLALNYIALSQNRFVLAFNNESEMKKFSERLNTLKIDYDFKDHSYANNFVSINKFFNNYSSHSIEMVVTDLSYLSQIRANLNDYLVKHNDCLILSNLVCSDGFLYEFEYFSRCLIHNFNRTDIDFLLSKISLSEFLKKLKATIEIVETALKMYTSDQLCVSFNGGKDCCVVLYLFYAVCLRLGYRFPLNVLYIKISNQFDEMDHFIDVVIKKYYGNSVEFIIFDEESKSLKECLSDLKNKNSSINAIFMGTRRTDSSYFKNMSAFAPTDGDWASFMRVNPILDWSYSEIWFFMRMLKLPYCSLYDNGYTSLDSSINTIPNVDLVKSDGSYSPAYMLENQDSERKSRKPKS